MLARSTVHASRLISRPSNTIPLRSIARLSTEAQATTPAHPETAIRFDAPPAPSGTTEEPIITPPIPGIRVEAHTPKPERPQRQLVYTVTRTPSRNLPVYQTLKSGGNLKITSVRKLGGNTALLVRELEGILKPRPEYVKINPLTGHVLIKGHYKQQIAAHLTKKGF